jgi:glycosyltransferase involved in cell wall biosynthesis
VSRPLRILVAHNVRRDRPGGMNRIMERIHVEVARGGHHVDYFAAEDVPPGARGRFGRFLFPALVRNRALAEAQAGRGYDLVNVHEPSGAALTARPPIGTRVVVTSHGVEQRGWELALEERRLGREWPGWKTRVVWPLTGLWQCNASLRRADHVFCLSEEDRAFLAARLGIDRGRTTRMMPAADVVFSAVPRDYRGADRLLFAGTWRKNKGIEDLVPAVNTLVERHPGIRLVVLGAGFPPAAVLRAFDARARARVRCVETRTEAETAQEFASADLFVLPSLFEGTPLTLMEAMMSGLPIVTTETSGMRDVIRHGVNGRLIPTRSPDAIVREIEHLMASENERGALGRAAQADARERYTWERVAAPIRVAYESLCEAS